MITLSFRNSLHDELCLEENMNYEFKRGITVSTIMNDLGIDACMIGLITVDGTFVLPANHVDDNKTIVFYPYVFGG